jgi:glycerol-3-phosphate dehydrogenase (NAD(P)+)
VGMRLSKGETLEHIIESLGSVAEGVSTTPAAYALAQKLGVDAPIITAVYRVLAEGASPIEEFKRVTMRDAKEEVTL